MMRDVSLTVITTLDRFSPIFLEPCFEKSQQLVGLSAIGRRFLREDQAELQAGPRVTRVKSVLYLPTESDGSQVCCTYHVVQLIAGMWSCCMLSRYLCLSCSVREIDVCVWEPS